MISKEIGQIICSIAVEYGIVEKTDSNEVLRKKMSAYNKKSKDAKSLYGDSVGYYIYNMIAGIVAFFILHVNDDDEPMKEHVKECIRQDGPATMKSIFDDIKTCAGFIMMGEDLESSIMIMREDISDEMKIDEAISVILSNTREKYNDVYNNVSGKKKKHEDEINLKAINMLWQRRIKKKLERINKTMSDRIEIMLAKDGIDVFDKAIMFIGGIIFANNRLGINFNLSEELRVIVDEATSGNDQESIDFLSDGAMDFIDKIFGRFDE